MFLSVARSQISYVSLYWSLLHINKFIQALGRCVIRNTIPCAVLFSLKQSHEPYSFQQTTTAGSIAFGFVHQCRSLSSNCKVLATAFSNVGADNLAETFLRLGLKVVRVGKPSGVSESLWDHTLEAAIQRDPNAQKALEEATRISAKIKKVSNESSSRRTNKGSLSAERAKRDAVTSAVKDSIQVR